MVFSKKPEDKAPKDKATKDHEDHASQVFLDFDSPGEVSGIERAGRWAVLQFNKTFKSIEEKRKFSV